MTRTVALRLLAPVADPRRLTLLVVLSLLVTSLGVLAIPRGVLGWDANTFSSGSETLLISLQNQARASGGRKALKQDLALRKIARWRSKDMIDRDYFSHTIKGTTRNVFWYMEHKYGYCFKLAGENIGTVKWPGASEEDATKWVFEQFMNSSGHRRNIMGSAWDVVGVGAYKASGDTFMWTVIFADRCSSSAPKPTPRPTPKPTARPRATPRPTAKPKPAAATPRPTTRPSAAPTATPSPSPTAIPTLLPILAATPSPSPTPRPTPRAPDVPPGQLRITDPPAELGLVDSILQSITAQFFGGGAFGG
ncbi:MAG TPA: CAP domain-containing protein [Candidatus Limnocylindrales bacterium]|nr:CAP domain-containing protein [Candidatus Limnocylindrales bacterium]